MERVFAYGVFGCFVELAWTGLIAALRYRDPGMKGRVSLWMFLVYGLGLSYGFDLLAQLAGGWPFLARGLLYVGAIWGLEAIVGLATRRKLWDYSTARWHWRGVVRFDYAPAWFAFGLLVEEVRATVDPVLAGGGVASG